MISDLGEFEKLLKICRKQGVRQIELGGVSVTFGEITKKRKDEDDSDADIPTDEPTPEQLMYYSVGAVEQ